MKRLSDYEGDQAIELWGELLEPVAKLLAADDIRKLRADAKEKKLPRYVIVKEICKTHPGEIIEIMKKIDPDIKVNGLTIVSAFAGIIADVATIPEIKDFFQSVGQTGETAAESIG